jgi:hypothetical protein
MEPIWVCPTCRAGDCLNCDITTAEPVGADEPVPVCACLRCSPVWERLSLAELDPTGQT